MCFFFFKQKTAYDMRISDWSSDVCSSDLILPCNLGDAGAVDALVGRAAEAMGGINVLVNNAGVTRDNLAMRMKDEERSEERRVGKEGVRTCRSRWSPDH